MTTVYDFTVKRPDGTDCSLKEYQGKILLIVNTATGCGLAKQFAGLEKLHQDYKEQGFHVLGFPCKQFSGQEPVENGRMEHVCQAQFGVTFPLFAKIKVNGTEAHPLYQFLKKKKKKACFSAILNGISQNF